MRGGVSAPVEIDAVPSSMAISVPRNRRESVSTASLSPPLSLKIPENRSTMASRPRVTSPSSSSISASGVNRAPSALRVLLVVGLDERGEQVGDGPDVGLPLRWRRGLVAGGCRGGLPRRPVLGRDQAQGCGDARTPRDTAWTFMIDHSGGEGRREEERSRWFGRPRMGTACFSWEGLRLLGRDREPVPARGRST